MIGKAVVIFSLLLSLADGCNKSGQDGDGGAPPFNRGPANVACNVRVDYPHQSSTDRSVIDGKTFVTCQGQGAAPEDITIEVKLQRRNQGEWFDIPSSLALQRVVTPVKLGQAYFHLAVFPCTKVRKGDVFRTAGRGGGTFAGSPALSQWKYSPDGGIEVKCR